MLSILVRRTKCTFSHLLYLRPSIEVLMFDTMWRSGIDIFVQVCFLEESGVLKTTRRSSEPCGYLAQSFPMSWLGRS